MKNHERTFVATILWSIVFLACMAGNAYASPFLMCDPQDGVEGYEVEGLDFVAGQSIPAEADGSIMLDMAPLTEVGLHNITVKACNMWGCSDPSPFSFTRPLSPTMSVNIRLEP